MGCDPLDKIPDVSTVVESSAVLSRGPGPIDLEISTENEHYYLYFFTV